jgi:hypothetical protein
MYAVRIGLVGTASDSPPDSGGDSPERTIEQVDQEGGSLFAGRGYLWGLLGVILIVGLLGVYVLSSRQSQPPTPTTLPAQSEVTRWEQNQALPQPRFGLAVVAYDKHLFAIGGETATGITGEVGRFNPILDSWELIGEKPIPVSDVAAGVIGGKIYVPGGRIAETAVTNILEIYDPREDTWAQGASLPISLSAYAAVAFEGRLYVFGGWDGNRYLDTVFAYDPGQDLWEELPGMSTPRAYAGAAIAGERIYVVGGMNESGYLTLNEEYFPGQAVILGDQAWQSRAPLPEGRSKMGMVSIAGIIHLIGGEGGAAIGNALKYFPQNDAWEPFDLPVSESWSQQGVGVLETNLYGIGGLQNGTLAADNFSYKAIYTIAIPVFREQ